MKAVRFSRFGPPEVLRWQEVPEPIPRRGEVRIAVRATAVNPKDALVRKGRLLIASGPRPPAGLGHDLAGVVDALGPGVTHPRVGQEVFGMTSTFRFGAHAEKVCLKLGQLADKPMRASMVEAAATPLAGSTALQALRDRLQVKPGETVLINGASGGVGVFAVQIAGLLGAKVSAVCSRASSGLVMELGADEIIAYDERDPRQLERRFDAVFDVFGNLPFDAARPLLRAGGRYCTTIPRLGNMARDLWSRWGSQPALLVVVRSRRADLETLARWIDDQQLRVVIDRTWPIGEIAEAHRYIETKRARGKVVLVVPASSFPALE